MHRVNSLLDPTVIAALKRGGVVVARTDTIYGMLARANDDQAVERLYQLKGRSHTKSPIVLIDSRTQLFDEPPLHESSLLDESWPGKVSIIVPSTRAPQWLRRDNASVAYRLPDHDELRQLIRVVGPLAAPSANPEGKPPAANIDEAFAYFGEAVDVYVDGGEVTDNIPSQLIAVATNGEVTRLR